MTDDELGRAAATALKERFPAPSDVDLPVSFDTPAPRQRRTALVAAAACVLAVAGVSTGLALTAGEDQPTAAPIVSSPRQGATRTVLPPPAGPACIPSSADVTVRLGGAKLSGNTHPARVTAPAGYVVRVAARFGTRTLTFPASRSTDLALICHLRRGSVYTSLFRAAHPGTANVVTHTSGCGPCMNASFRARITVIRPSAQLDRLRTRFVAPVRADGGIASITADFRTRDTGLTDRPEPLPKLGTVITLYSR